MIIYRLETGSVGAYNPENNVSIRVTQNTIGKLSKLLGIEIKDMTLAKLKKIKQAGEK